MTQFSNIPPLSGMQSVSDQPFKTSGMAIASLVLGILGLCTGGVLSLIGIPLGIVALGRISKQPEQLKGKGVAIAGITVSSITLVVGCMSLLVGLILPALAKARQNAMAVRDMASVKMIGNEIILYAQDHFDEFPPPGDWVNALSKGGNDITPLTISISAPNDGRAYAMNAKLSGKKLSDVRAPDQTVLLFEVEAGSPLSGTSELMTARPHTRAGYLICFVDGHVKIVRPDGLTRLVWEP